MINMINKSVKNISLGITNLVTTMTENTNYKIQLCVIDSMNLNCLFYDNVEELEKNNNSIENKVIIILHSNFNLNIYYLEEELELKCFFTNKFLFPINFVDKFNLGINKTYTKELPLVALICNNITKNNEIHLSKTDYLLKIYSIKNKRVVHTLRFKKQIINFISRINHFAVAFSDYCIKLFENDKMTNILTIKPQEINLKVLNSNKIKDPIEIQEKEVIINSFKFFDISNNMIIYFNDLENLPNYGKVNENCSASANKNSQKPQNNSYSLGNMTIDAFNGLSKFKDWSFNQFKDFSNLKQAYFFKNNADLDISKNGCFLNIQKISDISGHDINKIFTPFFKDGISFIKFFHAYKYFIVGNKNAQIFYIYELYPSTNLRINQNFEYNHRIIYSFYRGITNASINNIEWSSCKNFISISSKKGTIHVYYLPKIESQIFENHSNFNYKKFHDLYQNVSQAIKIEKIKFGNFFSSNLHYQTFANLISNFRINIESLSPEFKTLLSISKSERFLNLPILFCLCENSPTLHVYVLVKDKSKETVEKNETNSIKMKDILLSNYRAIYTKKISFLLNFSNPKNEVDPNYLDLLKKGKSIYIPHLITESMKMKQLIEIETTEKNYAPLQINPLFCFNLYKPNKLESNDQLKIVKDTYKSISSEINHNQVNDIGKKFEKSINEISPKNECIDNTSSNENQIEILRNSKNNNLNNSKRNSNDCNKTENEISHIYKTNGFSKNNPQNLKKKSIYKSGYSSYKNISICEKTNFTPYYIIKGKTNSLGIRKFSNYEEVDDQGNSSRNDIQVSEKILCQDLLYVPKEFNNENRIIALNSDSFNENMVFHPKLIIQPYQFFQNNKSSYPKLSNSISDKSSSKENSICTNNQKLDNLIATSFQTSNDINRNSIQLCSNINGEVDSINSNNSNHFNFFKSKETFLESQIKLAMETNLIENFKTNVAQVKIYNDYNIDENYMGK